MEDTDTADGRLGEIELKLFKSIILKDVAKMLRQVSNKGENFLYPVILDPPSRDISINPLVKGEFMGHEYEIRTNGMNPTAYVSCNEKISYANKDKYGSLPVHGGCTFAGTRTGADGISTDGIWVGWDYGHNRDFMSLYNISGSASNRNGKKWTVPEVMQDVIRAILYIEENS